MTKRQRCLDQVEQFPYHSHYPLETLSRQTAA